MSAAKSKAKPKSKSKAKSKNNDNDNKNGQIIVVTNDKGGVGKTTTVVNLASGIALKKKKVLLIDLDGQCDTTDAVLPENTIIDHGVYQLLDPESTDRPAPEECIYPTVHKNLFVMPNIRETKGLLVPLAKDDPDSNLYLRVLLRDYLAKNFDFTIIDTPPAICPFMHNGLYMADHVIIPILAGSSNSLKGIRTILDSIDSARSTGNPDLKFLKILFNRLDKRKNVHAVNLEAANTRFGSDNVFKNTLPTCVEFENIELLKGTIFSRKPKSKGAHSFRKLSTEFLKFFEV